MGRLWGVKCLMWGSMLCATVAVAGYAPNLKPNADLDGFILRIAGRYGLTPPRGLFAQPMNVADLRPFLEQVDSLDAEGVLSKQESYQLRTVRRIVYSEGSLLEWRRDSQDVRGHVHLSLLGRLEPNTDMSAPGDSAGVFLAGTIAPRFKANVQNLSVYSGIDVSTEFVSDSHYIDSDYQPYKGVPYTLYGRVDSARMRAIHTLRGGIRYEHRNIELETAVDQLRLGPALYTPLTFSANAPPMTYLRGNLDMGPLGYLHSFGLLKSQKDKPKYFYMHRLDIPVSKLGLTVGVNEVIITGSTTDERYILEVNEATGDTVEDRLRPYLYNQKREWEWVYMIPFVPFSFAEQYIGDRDNAALSFDMNLFFPRGFRWYWEVFLDDITAPWTILSDDWGNKWAATIGCQYFGSLFSRDFAAVIEYTRVEPWVYTHFYGGSHRFTHFGTSLGAPMGPNSDQLTVQLEGEITPRHTGGVFFANRRKNEQARGGSVRHVFQEPAHYPERYDSEKKEFLGPGTVRSTRIGLNWTMMPFELFHVHARGAVEIGEQDKRVWAEITGGFVF